MESALLGGFYYKHYLLATNVIGSRARGTMSRPVEALRHTFDGGCFPLLDAVRADLGLAMVTPGPASLACVQSGHM